MAEREAIFVFGASGHARVVIDVIEREGRYRIAFIADDDTALKGSELYGYPVIGGKEELAAAGVGRGIVAIGSNTARAGVAEWLTASGVQLVRAQHPSAQIGRDVEIGPGTVVMAAAVVNPGSRIGDNVIVNTRASVDHDCRIGSGVHIAPGAVLCGNVAVGEGSFICAGATVIPNITVGRHVVVGAGSTVLEGIPDYCTAVGVPARVVRRRGPGGSRER